MTFEEFMKDEKQVSDEAFEIAKTAWEEATRRAAQVARNAAKRYTCKKRKGLCIAIADQIEQQK